MQKLPEIAMGLGDPRPARPQHRLVHREAGLVALPVEAEHQTGEPVRRLITAPHIGGAHSEASEKRKLSDGNLDKLGFTKYVKSDSGYDKVAGKGPDLSQVRKLMDGGGG